jgi:DNA (cytosine-5)-methyltransferase 1
MLQAGVRPSEIVLLAGGPPCQPFSKAGNWTQRGPTRMRDPRAETIHAYLAMVAQVKPEVLLFENVPGFAFRGRAGGLPTLHRELQRINRRHALNYQPQLIKIDAADYGIPQHRERLFLLAHREGRLLQMPSPTHGPRSQVRQPYLTAWDAIGDLDREVPELAPGGRWGSLLGSIPEGKNYLWHTPGAGGCPLFGWRTRYWSFLLKLAKNLPSWTISASPGPSAGPFHWRNRLLTVEEMCRLQTFPPSYTIAGNRRAAQRQLGNAVPCALAELLGLEIRRQLLLQRHVRRKLRLIPQRRRSIPRPEPVQAVPGRYLKLIGNHPPHPGSGKGPAPRVASF